MLQSSGEGVLKTSLLSLIHSHIHRRQGYQEKHDITLSLDTCSYSQRDSVAFLFIPPLENKSENYHLLLLNDRSLTLQFMQL